jgi:putative transcriptional regulator
MTPNHHPQPETLISYVAGTLPNSISCVVACHISMCRSCADQARWLGAVGGIMLKNLATAPADNASMERMATRFSTERLPPRKLQDDPAPIADPLLPKPLARYLGMGGGEIPWKKVVKGVRQYWVKLPEGSGKMRLLRLAPKKLLLEHTHTGLELTLVLQGVYGDHTGDYKRGDVIESAEGSLHQPGSSGDEECVCLIGSERTPHYSRLMARLLQPILGF